MPGLTNTLERPRASHTEAVLRVIFDANRGDAQRGIYSVCSAHTFVLEAACEAARADGSPLLIEATCNQVNHLGGYTGMTPADFRRDVEAIAERCGLAASALVLGGDHLGPNPWRDRPAAEAMHEAQTMVVAYVEAGFTKIHLDASMACADDASPLDDRTIADRAARLCRVAEAAAARVGTWPVYVIGTEVPTPGGETGGDADGVSGIARIAVTQADSIAATLAAHREAFDALGLQDVWTRVIAIVAQPGVDFDDRHVLDYDSDKAAALSASILRPPGLVFEAHSTDYQTDAALTALVRDHFAILKVGPALTFALREALFALSYIEDALIDDPAQRSRLREVVDAAMCAQPGYWAPYYRGDAAAQSLARRFSYSDRIRYYWPQPRVAAAVERLLANLDAQRVPETLVAQWLPDVYAASRKGTLAPDPRAWVRHRIRDVIARYARACGMHRSG